jgi:site-specific DNA-methyltransferase (cytosine-N4-specific)
MPESVTDRCTKSHEYIFMLTKSERYYYDAESIKEKAESNSKFHGSLAAKSGAGGDRNDGGRCNIGEDNGSRNHRDVWTVATQPCPEAHFATFPPKLIEPMILAGSKVGDTILDPFIGSGTTAIQAVRLHRHYLGCELNPEYVRMAERRINDMVGPLFVGGEEGT